MGGSIAMEWKRCQLIGCWTHNVTLIYDLNHDLHIAFVDAQVQIAVFQAWMVCLIWNKMDKDQQMVLTLRDLDFGLTDHLGF